MERSIRFKIWIINEKQHMDIIRLTTGGPYSIVKESWKYAL
jgi:hypothetical protein